MHSRAHTMTEVGIRMGPKVRLHRLPAAFFILDLLAGWADRNVPLQVFNFFRHIAKFDVCVSVALFEVRMETRHRR